MILAVALVLAAVVLANTAVLHRALTDERARSRELLTLLEAKAAPVEHATYIAPWPESAEAEYISTPDGLISVAVNDG